MTDHPQTYDCQLCGDDVRATLGSDIYEAERKRRANDELFTCDRCEEMLLENYGKKERQSNLDLIDQRIQEFDEKRIEESYEESSHADAVYQAMKELKESIKQTTTEDSEGGKK